MTIDQHAEAAAEKIVERYDEPQFNFVYEIIAKHMQSAIDEATAPLRVRIDLLTVEIARMEAEVKYANGERIRVQDAIHKIDRDIIQTLGKALHYPWFKHDQKNFPGATEADGVAVGDHVAETLAVEAAKRIAKLEGLGPLIERLAGQCIEAGKDRMVGIPTGMAFRPGNATLVEIERILKGGAS